MSAWHRVIATLVAAAGLLCILQLWYPVVTTEVFVKLLVTLGVLAAVAGIIGIMRREERQKKRGYLE